VAVPLLSSGKTIGVIGAWSREPREFTRREADILGVLASHLTPVLELTRFGDKWQPPCRALEGLLEVARAASTRDFEAVCRTVEAVAADLVGLEVCGVAIWNPAANRLQTVTDPAGVGDPLVPERSATAEAFRLNQPIVVQRYPNWSKAIPRAAAQGFATVVAVPLLAAGRPIGALAAGSRTPIDMRAEAVEMVTLFAAHVGAVLDSIRQDRTDPTAPLALENARLRRQRRFALPVSMTGDAPGDRGSRRPTRSQEAVLRLLVRGRSNREIAHELHLSLSTVKFHLGNLYTAWNVTGRVHLATTALREGWS
jgi:DNA-binding CsgD family transcriptional regulator/putative methionine-R-sulfoxide reductase with GAF domain